MLKRCIVLLALLLSFGACDRCGDGGKPGEAAATKAAAAVPDGLAIELMIPHPGATAASLREAAGGPALFLPRTFGGMVSNLLGLPLRMAEQVDEDLPMVAAATVVGKDDDAPLSLALALHVKSGKRFVQQLTTGADGTFSAEPEGELTWLTAGSGGSDARLAVALAVIDNYLVLGPDRGGVRRLAPYLARNLAVSQPAVTIEQGALVEVFNAKRLRPLVTRVADAAAGVELPKMVRPLIDLKAAADKMRSVVADVGPGRIVFTIDDKKLRLSGELSPRDAGAAKRFAAFPTVEPEQLLTLPDDVVAALAWGEDLESRTARVDERAESLAPLLGDGWKKGDTRQIADALKKVAAARGDRTVLALRCSGVGLTGLAHGDVRDADALRAGLEALTDLRDSKPVKKKLKEEELDLAVKKTRLELVPHDVWRLRLSPTTPTEDADAGAEPDPPIDLLYAVAAKRFLAAAGMDTVATMQRLEKPDSEHALSAKESMKVAVTRLGKRVWLAALLDPQGMHACRQGMPGGRFATPITLGAGLEAGKIRGSLEVARPLLKLLVAELGL